MQSFKIKIEASYDLKMMNMLNNKIRKRKKKNVVKKESERGRDLFRMYRMKIININVDRVRIFTLIFNYY